LLTVNGNLTINSGGGVTSNPPIYGSASFLIYNTTSNPYGVATEWTGNGTTAGAGIPQNVTIQSSNNVTMPNGNRGLAGNLLIQGTATLTLNATSGDLYVGGNITNNSNFVHNTRAVFLNGGAAQTINGSFNTAGATNNFAFLILNNTSGGITANANVLITGTSGSPLQLLGAGAFNIATGITVTMSGNGGNLQVSGGTRVINFNAATSIFAFTGTKTVTSTSSGLLSFTSTVSGGSARLSAGVDFGAGLTTIGNNTFLIILGGGFVNTNPVTYATGSTLSFRNGASYVVSSTDRTWGPGTSGAGVPFTVEVLAASTVVDVTDDRTVTNNVVITNGTLQNITASRTITVAPAVTTAQSAVNLTAATATLNIGGGNLTIGPSGGGNQALNLGGGAMTVSSGTVTINGNLTRAAGGSTLTQTGGTIVIDGNSGTAGTSVASGTPMFRFASTTGTGLSMSAGTVRIVDPPHSSYAATSTVAVSLSNGTTAPSAYWISGTHTFEFGDGVSTETGNSDGFVIDTWVSTHRIPLRNVTINAGNGTGRWVNTASTSANGTHIMGTLTINSGSEFRNTLSTAAFVLGGDIVNNGTLTSTQTITLQTTPANGGATTSGTVAQSITGSGVFRNATASPTASFTNILFDNTAAAPAITFNVGSLSVSGAVNFTNGVVSIGGSNDFTLVGTATSPRTNGWLVRDGSGQLFRSWTTNGTYTYPIGDSNGTYEYSPVTVNLTTNATARTIGARVTDASHPQMNTPVTAVDFLSRYWSFTDNSSASLTGTVAMTYIAGASDVNGTESLIKAAYYNGSTWATTLATPSSPTLTATSATYSGLNGLEFTGRNNPGTPYTWNGNTDNSWNTSTNWTPNGVPSAIDPVTIVSGTPNNLSIASSVSCRNLTVNGDFAITSAGTLTVTGTMTYTSGTATLDCASTFVYTSTSSVDIAPFNYGNLTASGGARVLPNGGTVGVCGTYAAGTSTTATGSTFIYNGTGAQTVVASTYNNLTIANNRGAANLTLASGTITVQSAFDVSTFSTTGTVVVGTSTIDLTSTSAQNIPAFFYYNLSNSGNGNRTWASTGTIDIAGAFSAGTGTHTITGSTVRYSSTGAGPFSIAPITTNIAGSSYNNLIIAGSNGSPTTYAQTSGSTIGVNGNFTLVSGVYRIALAGSFATNTLNVFGDFTMSGGTLSLTNSGTLADAGVLNLHGNYSMSGGTIARTSSVLNGTVNFVKSSGVQTLTYSAGSFSITTGTGFAVSVGNGTTTNTLQLLSNFTASSIAMTVQNNASIDFGTNIFTSTGSMSFALAAGSTLITANTAGIASTGATGSVQSTGSRTFATTANYVYNGTAAQITGTGLPATVNNLTFNNTAATTTDVTLSAPTTVAGTLAFTSGKVDLGTNTLTVSNTASSAVTVGTGFAQTSGTGTLNRALATGANTYLFPVGNGANYTPASYAFSANATAFTLNVRSVPAVHPDINSNYTQTDYIDNRYWVTSVTGTPSTYSYTPTYTFLAGDVVGSLSSIYLNKWNGTIWSQPNIQAASGTSLTTASALDATTGSLNATAEWVGRFNPTAVSYTWNGSVDNTWGDSGNWTPTGVPTIADNVTISAPGTNTLNITGTESVVNFTLSSTGTFTMSSGSSLTVVGNWVATTSATPTFDCASTLNISGTSSASIPAWSYGSLNLAGGPRVLASSGTIGICGTYTTGTTTTFAGSTINYNGSGAQTIVATNYEGLTISNNRGGATLTLASGTIDVSGVFTVSASNFTSTVTGNTFNFSSASAQSIPAFNYNILTNSGNGNRTWASSGTIDINASFSPGTGTHTITGSTVRYSSTAATTFTLPSFTTNVGTRWYNNLEFVGGASTTWQLASAFNLAISGNLSLTGSGNLIVGNNALANTMTVDGNVTMSNASRFTISAAGGGVLNVGGNFVTTSTAAPSLAIATGSATATVNITGNMTISNGQVNVSSTTGAVVATLAIVGDLNIDGTGVLQLEGTASTTGTGVVTVGGNFTATSTAATIVDFGQGTNIGGNNIAISGNFSKSGTGTFGVSGAPTTAPATFGFRFVRAGTQTYSSTGAVSDKISYTIATGSTLQLLTNMDLGTTTVNPPVSFTVGGTLNAGIYSVTGMPNASTSSFTLSAGGTIQTANALGLNDGTSSSTLGGLSATSTKTYNVGGNYVFNGSVAQNTNFPASVTTCSTLTINNAGNIVTLNKALSVTSGVALNAGVLSIGAFNLTLSTSGANVTTTGSFSNSTMIAADGTGSLIKTYATGPTSISFTWPIGDLTSGADYSPVTISFTGTGSGSLGFRVVDAVDPNNGSAVNYITRYWVPTIATFTTYSWNGSLTYTSGDIVGTESSLRVNAWDNTNSAWLEYTSGSAGSNVVTVTTGPTSGSLAAGSTLTARTDVPLYYRAVASTAWNLASTWEVSTDPLFVSPAPVAASIAPNYLNSGGITIGNGFAVTMATTVLVDQLVIQNGGSLTTSLNAFTVANGTGTDVTVDQGGLLQIGGTGTITIQASATMQINGTYRVSSTAAPVVTTSGTTTIGATGTYQHSRDAGIIPTCTWTAGSTCLVTGTVNTAPSGWNQSFHHLTINATIASSQNFGSNLSTVLGDFNLTTNSGTASVWWSLSSSGGGAVTLTVSGNLNLNNGALDLGNSGTHTVNLIVNGNTTMTGTGSTITKRSGIVGVCTFNGDFTQNAGVVDLAQTASSNTTYNFRGNVTFNGTLQRSAGGTHILNFDKASGEQQLSQGTPITTAQAITWNFGTGSTANTVRLMTDVNVGTSGTAAINVGNGSTLDFQDKTLLGSNAAFTMGATATLRIGSPFGITTATPGATSGNLQTLAASRSVSATGTFVYSGAVNQVTGNLLPATLTGSGRITIANTGTTGNNVVTLTTTGTTTPQLNLVSGLWAAGTGQQLNITSGGTVNATGGDFQSGGTAGVLNFPGTGTFTGNCNPYNVYTSGGVNFGTGTVTIAAGGLFRLNNGGFVSTNAPFYHATSTLQYNTNSGSTYGRNLEWSATSGRGYPGNVTVSNNNTLNLGNAGTNVARACAGNLTVDAGSTLSMSVAGSVMTAPLTVAGSVTVPGTLTLSSSAGGDINVGGDWTVNGTFNPSLRAVFFNGTGSQSIFSSHTFPYVFINNTGAGVELQANLFVGIQMGFTSGTLTLNNFNLSVNSVASVTGGNATSYAITNGTGRFIQTVGGTAVNYPIGTTSYNPLQLTNSGTSDTFSLAQIDGASGVELDPTKIVLRQWQVSEGTSGGSNLTVRAQWNAPVAQTGEEAANFLRNDAQKFIGVYNGSAWAAFNATLAGTNPYTYQASGINTVGTIEVGIQNAFLPVPIISSVSALTGYTGDAITITGTNMGTVTSVTFGGVAGNITAQSSTSLTVEIMNGATGNIVVTNPAGTASVSGFVYLGYITDNNTDWNTGTTWRGGNVPPAGAVVTVNSTPTVNATVANAPLTITVNASRSIVFGASGALNATTSITNNGTINMTAGGTLSLANNGVLTNNGTFTGGAGTFVFSGTGTINGAAAATFNNLTVNGPASLVTVPTINGILLLNPTGFVSVSPNYGSASTVQYNTGGTYLRSSEWFATSGAGYPANVRLSANTTLDLGYNGTGVARQCSGNLTIDAGSTLSMNNGANVMTAALTVLGDVTINGTIVLSSAIGGDLYVGGNWTRNTGGTFTHNNRAVFFIGSGNQTFTGPAGGNFFPFVLINKPSGNVILANDVTITSSLTFMSTNMGNIDAASFNLIVSNSATGAIDRQVGANGHVIGNLQRAIATGTNSYTFQVGTSTGYAPAVLALTSVTGTGSLTVSNTGGDHPQLATSNIGSTRNVNRYWNISNSGLTITSYDATFNFNSGDVDGGANTANFIIGRYTSGVWYGVTTGTLTSTSSQGTGLSTFGEFAIGECKTPNDFAVTGGGANCTTGPGTAVGLSGSDTWASYQLYRNGSPVGSTVSGTGSAISFGLQSTAGNYTVVATNVNSPTCFTNMSGTAVITNLAPVDPLVSITASTGATVCAGTSVTFTASPINGGAAPTYQWYENGSPVGTGGTTYTDANPTAGDSYYVVMTSNASCITSSTATSNTFTAATATTYYIDADGDGFGSAALGAATVSACEAPAGYAATNTDCNDANELIFPGADPFCNAFDADCDGNLDIDGAPVLTFYQDADGDGFGNGSVTTTSCDPVAGYVLNASDCNDASAAIRPGATEVLDSVDNNCNGLIDEGFGPSNDSRLLPRVAVFSTYGLNCNLINGTLVGATPSPEATATCLTGEDVWYMFNASAAGISIEVLSSVNNLVVELQTESGTPLSTEDVQSAVGNEVLNFTGLTIGQTYFICVRNYNSNAGTGGAASGTFQMCVRPLQHGQCLAYPNPLSLCDAINARFLRANAYVFNFTNTATNVTYSRTVNNGGTLLLLSSVVGLVPGQTYNLNISAVYNINLGNGSPEVITIGQIPGQSACTITMAPHPNLSLRTIDQCPNARKLNYQVANEPWVCNANYYEYKFTRVLPGPALPIFRTTTQLYSRFLTLSTVPGLELGATYNVEIRPIFAGGFPGTWSTTPSCVKIIGVALADEFEGEEEANTESVAVFENDLGVEALLYPNPTNGQEVNLVIGGYTGTALVKVIDLSGKVAFESQMSTLDQQVTNLRLGGLSGGLYTVIINLDGRVVQRKLLVTN
jgi:hypothetical protein